MNYFEGINQVEQAKKLYRKLALTNHPDRHPADEFVHWNAIMAQINAQYHNLLESLDGQVSVDAKGKEHTYYYNGETEQAIMDMIDQLLKAHLEGVEIWIVGTWLWVGGDTYQHKDTLKGLGLRWSGRRKRWYFHTGKYRSSRSRKGFNELCSKYGAKKVETDTDEDTPAQS